MIEMTIRTTVEINATATEAWALFGEGFGTWADWAPGIDKSTLQGPLAKGVLRINETPSLGTVTQELVHFEPAERSLSYEVRAGLPPFLDGMRNDWLIEPLGGGRSRLNGVALFQVKDAAAPKKPQLEVKMAQVLESFAANVRDTLEGRSAGSKAS